MLVAGTAHAGEAKNHLTQARALQSQLRFREAFAEAKLALEAGDASTDEVWQIHAFLAERAAALGFKDAAREEFGKALELYPGYAPAPDSSPKLLRPFEEAKLALQNRRLHAASASVRGSAGEVATRVTLADDTYGLVRGGTLYARTGKGGAAAFMPHALRFADPLVVTWTCEDPSCRHYFELRDASGNALLSLGSAEAPLSVSIPLVERSGPAPKKLVRTGTVLAAVSGIALAATLFFALSYEADARALAEMNANRGGSTQRAWDTRDASRVRNAILLWSSAGVSVAAGGTAAFTW
jgi:tetratricopeptide (TPR) repeat protein